MKKSQRYISDLDVCQVSVAATEEEFSAAGYMVSAQSGMLKPHR